MNIGITCYPTYGGSGAIATELGQALARSGHKIHFISYSIPFRLQEYNQNISFHDVEVMPYPLFKYPPYTLALAAKMAAVAEEAKLDVLHVHYAVPHATCAFLARHMLKSRDIKIITTLHGTDITLVGSDKSFYQITKFSIEESDGITAVSESLRQDTLSLFGIENEIRVIPNFVDTNRFKRKEAHCDLKNIVQEDEKVLLHVSNLRPVKRVTDVIRMYVKVKPKIKSKLLIVGEGPDRVPAQELAAELGLRDSVVFLGQQEGIDDILSCADLYLLPSEQESFGLSALEAMSCEVPVVGTNVGGVPELIQHGKNGFITEVGDVDKMAEHAISVLSDDAYRSQIGIKARQRVLDSFGEDRVVPQYEAYYEEVLNR
ncbi:MAG: N-acetyl-alpha-D-glucosaminyl L-malate synthase BshA [Candidatus Latescibacteria bacterium]|jgi:L-malate glycosyltransferase|nr:N-acetyl-alpha-D-glucosaminyl L-malate synthase BshA [Candidatus Latescibacterota bacterium]